MLGIPVQVAVIRRLVMGMIVMSFVQETCVEDVAVARLVQDSSVM